MAIASTWTASRLALAPSCSRTTTRTAPSPPASPAAVSATLPTPPKPPLTRTYAAYCPSACSSSRLSCPPPCTHTPHSSHSTSTSDGVQCASKHPQPSHARLTALVRSRALLWRRRHLTRLSSPLARPPRLVLTHNRAQCAHSTCIPCSCVSHTGTAAQTRPHPNTRATPRRTVHQPCPSSHRSPGPPYCRLPASTSSTCTPDGVKYSPKHHQTPHARLPALMRSTPPLSDGVIAPSSQVIWLALRTSCSYTTALSALTPPTSAAAGPATPTMPPKPPLTATHAAHHAAPCSTRARRHTALPTHYTADGLLPPAPQAHQMV